MKVVLHLNEHLLKSHKMTRSSVYYDMLNNASHYSEEMVPKYLVISPRKKYGLTQRSTNSASLTTIKLRKTEGGTLMISFMGYPTTTK